jgi:predicted TIM-barrel fold metal-dependent hydrolase
MTMPSGIGIVDTFFDLPPEDRASWSSDFGALFRDRESRTGAMAHAAGFLFKDPPKVTRSADPIGDTLREMDRFGIEKALIRVNDDLSAEAVTRHRDRFLGQLYVDPNQGMDMVRALARAYEMFGIVGASFFPAGQNPPVPINDKRAYPIYAKCVDLDIAIFVNAGVPGPRIPFDAQHVGLIDEVCWFFPELRVVLRHGCEPWTDLAVKLMLKWPNLYYSTSAFAPKYYPEDIVRYANTRGADKIIYAGYYPAGLTLDRIFAELPSVPFKDHVWPKFLRENALRVLKIAPDAS